MKEIELYFSGEKWQCSIGAVLALGFIVLSVCFLKLGTPFHKGFAYVCIPFMLILTGICISIIVRTPKDLQRISAFYQSEPAKLKTEELPRMQKVMKLFSTAKKIELAFFAVGVVLAIVFWKNDLMRGIAVAIIVLGIAFFTFDFTAEHRAKPYFQFLNSGK